MNIANVKPVIRCTKCHAMGVVRRKEKMIVVLECNDCNKEWKTYSRLCKDCGKPNGYVVEGPCMECYAQKYRSS